MSLAGEVVAPVWGSEYVRPPAVPDNWYMLEHSRALKPGRVISGQIGSREIVVMRSPDGARLAAFTALCAHMGCHLRHSAVEDGGLRCALHRRLISESGRFAGPDGRLSERLVQATYPVRELYGMVFVYLGSGQPPDLPLPRLQDGESWVAEPAGTFDSSTDWASLVANGFDMEHLSVVHRRRLIESATISQPREDAFRLSYRSRVTGRRFFDRVVKYISGDEVNATMTSWRGSMMLVESELAGRKSFFILSMCPKPDGGTYVRSVVGLRRAKAAPLERLKLKMTARLFQRFLADDFIVMDGLRWHPPRQVLGLTDQHSQALGHFFTSLGATEATL